MVFAEKIRFFCAVFATLLICTSTYAEQVYTVSGNGVIRSLQFAPCSGSDCRWTDIDRNSRTISVAGGPDGLFQLHGNGHIWRWLGEPCMSDICASWERLDRNSQTVAITAAGGELYQHHENGSIWRWMGQPCSGNACSSWVRLDNNSQTTKIVAADNHLYQLHENGHIYQWLGQPCQDDACRSWRQLDNNSVTTDIAAVGNDLFQLHTNGHIYQWLGQPCTDGVCRSWRRLDNNSRTRKIVAARSGVYQLHDSGWIWQWQGASCTGNTCSSWLPLDRNENTIDIAAAGEALYQLHRDGTVWRWGGQPCSNNECRSWDRLGTGTASFAQFNQQQGGLFVFDGMAYASSPLAENQIDRLRQFGFETHRTLGFRPLLTILINSSSSGSGNESAYTLLPAATYDQAIYSTTPGALSIVNFVKESSKGAFTLTKAGLVGPYSIAGSEPGDFLDAADADVNFALYDANRDGEVTTDELTILVIDNITHGWGANRSGCRTLDGVRVCRPLALAGGRSMFANLTHEIGHQFGPSDIYGSGNWNTVRALMGHPTAQREPIAMPLAPQSVEFGPWNRMRFGWLEPLLVSTTGSGSCTSLTAPSYAFAVGDAVLFYDPARGSTEYFIIEHRTNRATAGQFLQHDNLFPGRGLAPWYVNVTTDPEGSIDRYLDANGNERQDRLVLMIADPNGTPRNQRIQPPLAANGAPTALRWFDNGNRAANVMSRYASASDEIELQTEWNSGVPFPPSFTRTFPIGGWSLSARSDSELALPHGVFGISANNRSFELRSGDRRIPLSPTRWRCNDVRLQIPESVDVDEYELVATHPSWTSSHLLNVKVRVQANTDNTGPN